MTDETLQERCRAALLKACTVRLIQAWDEDGGRRRTIEVVSVPAAASCMARAIRAAAEQPDMYLAVDAALPPAQE